MRGIRIFRRPSPWVCTRRLVLKQCVSKIEKQREFEHPPNKCRHHLLQFVGGIVVILSRLRVSEGLAADLPLTTQSGRLAQHACGKQIFGMNASGETCHLTPDAGGGVLFAPVGTGPQTQQGSPRRNGPARDSTRRRTALLLVHDGRLYRPASDLHGQRGEHFDFRVRQIIALLAGDFICIGHGERHPRSPSARNRGHQPSALQRAIETNQDSHRTRIPSLLCKK